MKIIPVKLQDNGYNIHIEYGLIKTIPKKIDRLNLGNLGIVVTSSKLYKIYDRLLNKTFPGPKYKIITVVDGELAKSQEWLFKVIKNLTKLDGINKKIFIVCFGGGTIGDLGGFVASIYKRGIPYLQIPTTLLGQIDSSIGGKTAIDLPEAKNILGSFYQPRAVFIDPGFLSTLPLKELKQGIAEAIKYGVIKDKKMFYFLKTNNKKILNLNHSAILKVISTCAEIKARIVEKDEKETKGLRTILNFGHTLAHALESSLKYRKISHGEAVSLGMVFAGTLSIILKKCSRNSAAEISALIKLFYLPCKIKFNYTTLYKSLSYDKKFISGKIRMVILRKIGKVEVINNIPLKNIQKALYTFANA